MPRDGNRYDDRDSVCLCPFRKAAGNETLKTRRREIPANIVLPVEASIFEHRFLPSFSWETRDFLEMRGYDEKKSKREENFLRIIVFESVFVYRRVLKDSSSRIVTRYFQKFSDLL